MYVIVFVFLRTYHYMCVYFYIMKNDMTTHIIFLYVTVRECSELDNPQFNNKKQKIGLIRKTIELRVE